MKFLEVDGNYIYVIISLLSSFCIILVVVLVVFKVNSNVEYWKLALSFKKEVGSYFWSKVNSKTNYIVDRENIKKEEIKNQLNNLYPNSEIVDIEDELDCNEIRMCTIRFDTEEKKRITGNFVILNNCINNIEDIENAIKDLNLSISHEIIKICKKDDSVYFLIDAKDVFEYNSLNFLEQKELENSYIRFKEVLDIKKIFE